MKRYKHYPLKNSQRYTIKQIHQKHIPEIIKITRKKFCQAVFFLSLCHFILPFLLISKFEYPRKTHCKQHIHHWWHRTHQHWYKHHFQIVLHLYIRIIPDFIPRKKPYHFHRIFHGFISCFRYYQWWNEHPGKYYQQIISNSIKSIQAIQISHWNTISISLEKRYNPWNKSSPQWKSK